MADHQFLQFAQVRQFEFENIGGTAGECLGVRWQLDDLALVLVTHQLDAYCDVFQVAKSLVMWYAVHGNFGADAPGT